VVDDPLGPFSRGRIARLAQELLTKAGALGILPTPIEAVQEALGIRERIDIAHLPDELAAQKPAGWDRVLGAAWLSERTVFIDTSEPAPRRLFTDAHETAHIMCGWHRAALMLDTEHTLFRDVHDRLEAEANYGASCLVFQGADFRGRALHEPTSIAVPLALAKAYGASRHSALHFYVDEHPSAVALLVAGRYPRADGSLPVWRTVESQAFLRRFGRLHRHLRLLGVSTADPAADPLGHLIAESRRASEPPALGVALYEPQTARRMRFRAEAFFNGRCHFVLLSERAPSGAGRLSGLQRCGVP
jgi:hypothetical protein